MTFSSISAIGKPMQIAFVPPDFDAALKDSRATVTVEMEDEYKKMRGELKKRAAAVQPIGFLSPELLTPTREKKHD